MTKKLNNAGNVSAMNAIGANPLPWYDELGITVVGRDVIVNAAPRLPKGFNFAGAEQFAKSIEELQAEHKHFWASNRYVQLSEESKLWYHADFGKRYLEALFGIPLNYDMQGIRHASVAIRAICLSICTTGDYMTHCYFLYAFFCKCLVTLFSGWLLWRSEGEEFPIVGIENNIYVNPMNSIEEQFREGIDDRLTSLVKWIMFQLEEQSKSKNI